MAASYYAINNVVKQVLVDLAYNRISNANSNLYECQRMSFDYVGTLIAEISLNVFKIITPGACPQNELRGIYSQVNRLYQKLRAFYTETIAPEEEELYESFNQNSEAFGVLVLVYDILQAHPRLDCVLKYFDASYVYSRSLNTFLLQYAVKNGKTEMADKIFANSDNIDCYEALFLCLNGYADSEQKRKRLLPIMKKTEFREGDDRKIENYLNNTRDGINTRILVYENAVSHGIVPSMKFVVENILNVPNITDAQVKKVYQTLCMTKPKDADLYTLITDIYNKYQGNCACRDMRELVRGDIFIKLSDDLVKRMMIREDLMIDEKIILLEQAQQCKLNSRENDVIFTVILQELDDRFENRLVLVRKMTEFVDEISTKALTNYIVYSTLDGDRKPEILEELFKLDVKTNYMKNLPGQYMSYSRDSAKTKDKVIQMLGYKGIGLNSDMLLDIACKADHTDYLQKANFIKMSVNNGAKINPDCLSLYLERVPARNYHGELMNALDHPASKISDKALANYVLYSSDPGEYKINNALFFAERNSHFFGESSCEVRHLDSTVNCNLFQAYVLNCQDDEATVNAIVGVMKAARARLNATILVNGTSQKFKKYIMEHKAELSEMTLRLCNENNVFSFFF